MNDNETIIVPMPAFADPYNPAALGGSINMDIDDHPVEHSPDYAQRDGVGEDANEEVESEDEDPRAGWHKDDWKAQAEEYGLPVSGNLDELVERVTEYEQQEEGGEL